jgi:hypothetical protein
MKINIALIVLLFSGILVAQQPNLVWTAVFDGPMSGNGVDFFQDMVVDNDGNSYLICGTKGPASVYDFNITTVKINPDGVVQWSDTYDGGGTNSGDYPRDILFDQNGFIISIGKLRDNGIITIMYNLDGQVQWTYISPSTNDQAYSATVDNAGNIYIAGISRPLQNQSHHDAMIIKLNINGSQEFRNFYRFYFSPGITYRSYITQLIWDNFNDLIVVGTFARSGGNHFSNFVAKYNTSGSEIWRTLLADDSLYSQASYLNASVCVDENNNIYAAGCGVHGAYIDYSNYSVSRINNATGQVSWFNKLYAGNNGSNYVKSILANKNGLVYLSGISRLIGQNWGQVIIQFNSTTGDTIKSKFISNIGYVALNQTPNSYYTYNDMIIDNQNNIYFASPFFELQRQLRKFNQNLDTLFTMEIPGAFLGTNADLIWIDRHQTTILKNEDGVINFGSSGISVAPLGDTLDCLAAKLTENTSSVENTSSENITNYNLEQNYPNPFNPNTTIQFSIPEQSFVTLEIFNSLGEIISILVSENLNTGTYKYDWGAADLPSGVYLYRLQTAAFSTSKKMILLR